VQVANVDSTPEVELIVTGGSCDLKIIDLKNGNIKRIWSNVRGYDMVVGNVDADPQNEIIVSGEPFGSTRGWVVDAKKDSIEWTYAPHFGTRLAITPDVTNDGIPDLMGTLSSTIIFFDVAKKTPINTMGFSNPTGEYYYDLRVGDFDKNGQPDFLASTEYTWGLYNFKGEKIWTIPELAESTTDIIVDDIDKDGQIEMIVGAGIGSSETDFVFIINAFNGGIEYSTPGLEPNEMYLGLADITGDSLPEILTASEGRNGRRPPALTNKEKATFWQIDPRAESLTTFDINTVPSFFQAVGGSRSKLTKEVAVSKYDVLYILDAKTKAVIADFKLGGQINAVTFADIDKDGIDELLFATTALYAYKWVLNKYQQVWLRQSQFSSPIKDITLANCDADPALEIAYLEGIAALTVVSAETGAIEWTSKDVVSFVSSFAITDSDGDGRVEFFIGTTNGEIVVVDAPSHLILRRKLIASTPIRSLLAAPLDTSRAPEILFLSDRAYAFTTDTFRKIWQSPITVTRFYSDLIAGDIDNDKLTDIFIADLLGVFQYEVANPIISSLKNTEGGRFQITLSPNPVLDVLNIQIEHNSKLPYMLSIIGIEGKLYYSEKNKTEESLSIPIADLPKGMYILSLNNTKYRTNTKFIKF
jgi:WD40 repeat protein